MQPLYIIASQHRAALDALSDMSPDGPAFIDTMEGLQGEFEDKALAVAMHIRNLVSLAESIEAEAANMKERAAKVSAKAERISEYLKQQLLTYGGPTKLETPYFAIGTKKNPPKVVIDSESDIPEEYMRQKEAVVPPPAPDKKAIAAALNDGKDVPGVTSQFLGNSMYFL